MPKYYLLTNFLVAAAISVLAVTIGAYRIQIANAAGICEAEAWITGTRGPPTTTLDEDYKWATKVVEDYMYNPETRANICLGKTSLDE